MDTNKIEKGIELVLSGLVGNDWRADENFSETPARVAKAYQEMLYGHDLRRTDMAKFFQKKFPAAGYSQMIFCTGIKVYSMCPHHLLPVTYNVSVGYIPNEKEGYVIGASKLPRLVEALAAQAIIQEELTSEIAKEIQFHLNPTGIALVVSGQHLCMQARGIKQRGSSFETSEMRGAFRENESTRNEFFELLKNSQRWK